MLGIVVCILLLATIFIYVKWQEGHNLTHNRFNKIEITADVVKYANQLTFTVEVKNVGSYDNPLENITDLLVDRKPLREYETFVDIFDVTELDNTENSVRNIMFERGIPLPVDAERKFKIIFYADAFPSGKVVNIFVKTTFGVLLESGDYQINIKIP